jgi:hypothetical protein
MERVNVSSGLNALAWAAPSAGKKARLIKAREDSVDFISNPPARDRTACANYKPKTCEQSLITRSRQTKNAPIRIGAIELDQVKNVSGD